MQSLQDCLSRRQKKKNSSAPPVLFVHVCIVIPDTATEKPVRGIIVAIGPGKMLDDGKIIPLGVQEGETVLFGKYSGTEIKIDGKELVVMREDDVMGILE